MAESIPQRVRRWTRLATRVALVLVTLGVLFVVGITAWRFTREPDPANPLAGTPAAARQPGFTQDGEWPPDVEAAAHSLPAMIKNTLNTPNEQHGYQFQGSAGQTWAITVEPLADSTLSPAVRVYAPPGREVAAHAGSTGAELVITLPQDGPYRLLIGAAEGGTPTGRYLLTVWVR